MVEALKTITLYEGQIQDNPFEIITNKRLLLSNEAVTIYDTGIKFKLPETIDLKFHNKSSCFVLSYYFKSDSLILVLMNEYGGCWMDENTPLIKCEFVNKQKSKVRFVKIENGRKTFNIITEEIKEINIEKEFSNVNQVKFLTIKKNEKNEDLFLSLARQYRDICYVIKTEEQKTLLIEKFSNEDYEGKISFIIENELEKNLNNCYPFPKYIILDECENLTDIIKKQIEHFNITECEIFIMEK